MPEPDPFPETLWARKCERYGTWDFDYGEVPSGCIEKGCRCGSCMCECPTIEVTVTIKEDT